MFGNVILQGDRFVTLLNSTVVQHLESPDAYIPPAPLRSLKSLNGNKLILWGIVSYSQPLYATLLLRSLESRLFKGNLKLFLLWLKRGLKYQIMSFTGALFCKQREKCQFWMLPNAHTWVLTAVLNVIFMSSMIWNFSSVSFQIRDRLPPSACLFWPLALGYPTLSC